MRRSYRERMLLGDNDFVEVPTERLLSAKHAGQLAAGIDPQKATPSSELGDPAPFNEVPTRPFLADRSPGQRRSLPR